MCVDETPGGLERVKIGIRDADVPGYQAIRSDLDFVIGHDQRAVEQCEITDRASAVFADRKRTPGITRNMLADNDGACFFAPKLSKDLRALAIKSFAEFNIRWDRIRPPVTFDVSIFFNVAHE